MAHSAGEGRREIERENGSVREREREKKRNVSNIRRVVLDVKNKGPLSHRIECVVKTARYTIDVSVT